MVLILRPAEGPSLPARCLLPACTSCLLTPVAFWPPQQAQEPPHGPGTSQLHPSPSFLHFSFSIPFPLSAPSSPNLPHPTAVHFLASISTARGAIAAGKASPGGTGDSGDSGRGTMGRGLRTITDAPPLLFLYPRRVHTHPHPTETAGHAEETQ